MTTQSLSLVETILQNCAGRSHKPEEIMLRAMVPLGGMAAAAANPASAPDMDIVDRAMDLFIDGLEYLKAKDPTSGEQALIDNSYARSKSEGKPYTYYALGWGIRDKKRSHLQDRVRNCLCYLAALDDVPDEQYHREKAWRLDGTHNLLGECLRMIAGERPGITDEQLVELAEARLAARFPVIEYLQDVPAEPKRSAESMKLGQVMDQARQVREDRQAGKISREEADEKLDALRRAK